MNTLLLDIPSTGKMETLTVYVSYAAVVFLRFLVVFLRFLCISVGSGFFDN